MFTAINADLQQYGFHDDFPLCGRYLRTDIFELFPCKDCGKRGGGWKSAGANLPLYYQCLAAQGEKG